MPLLTQAQQDTLKADIQTLSQAGQPLAAFYAAQDWDSIAAYYNALASPDYLVWRTDALVQDVFDAITWSSFTPADAADNTVTYSNRLLIIQTKQMNLQNFLGRVTLDASKANLRAGLRDAVINLPAGASGANVSAGGASGVNVMNALTRKGTVLEKLLVSSTATTGGVTAGIMGFQGSIDGRTILDIHP